MLKTSFEYCTSPPITQPAGVAPNTVPDNTDATEGDISSSGDSDVHDGWVAVVFSIIYPTPLIYLITSKENIRMGFQ